MRKQRKTVIHEALEMFVKARDYTAYIHHADYVHLMKEKERIGKNKAYPVIGMRHPQRRQLVNEGLVVKIATHHKRDELWDHKLYSITEKGIAFLDGRVI